ncbi:hypothetical protein C8J55DRAFT_162060 [Lentinula edodes]|uniref:Uncharacterized protein n=1 Tax=Lentinula lateritia TaxID=40482 RepID=A0A9W9AZY6_9AGAR|nr:hypothetical protein C8J55DRAFT_162060 [Lentinula edodes]
MMGASDSVYIPKSIFTWVYVYLYAAVFAIVLSGNMSFSHFEPADIPHWIIGLGTIILHNPYLISHKDLTPL